MIFSFLNGKQFYSINVQLICEIASLEIWEAYSYHYNPFDVIILSWSRIKGSVLLHMDVRWTPVRCWTHHGAFNNAIGSKADGAAWAAMVVPCFPLHRRHVALCKLAQHGSLLLSCDCRKDWWALGWTDMFLSLPVIQALPVAHSQLLWLLGAEGGLVSLVLQSLVSTCSANKCQLK